VRQPQTAAAEQCASTVHCSCEWVVRGRGTVCRRSVDAIRRGRHVTVCRYCTDPRVCLHRCIPSEKGDFHVLGVCNSSFATTVKRDVDNPATPRPVWRHTPLPTVAWSVPLGCTRLGPRQGVCTGVASPSRRLPRPRAHPHVRGVRARTGETPWSAVIHFALCRPNDYGSNPVRPMRTDHTSTT